MFVLAVVLDSTGVVDDLIPTNNLPHTVEWGSAFSNQAAQTWNHVWDVYFDLGNTSSLAGQSLWKNFLLGCFIILAFAILYLVYELSSQAKSSPPEQYEALIIALLKASVVALFIAANGRLMVDLCLGIRNLILWFNDLILQTVVVSNDFQNLAEAYAKFKDWKIADATISSAMTQCEVLLGQDQLDCITEQVAILKARLTLEGGPVPSDPSGILENVNHSLQAFLQNPQQALNHYVVSLFEHHVSNLLMAMMTAFQFLMELSLFVTALLCPLAFGGILFPFRPNPFIAWLTGFLSIGFCKICFNFTCGMAAVAAIEDLQVKLAPNAPMGDQPLFIIFGFFAPIFASGMATLGGMAIWQGLTNAIGSTARQAVDLIMRFV